MKRNFSELLKKRNLLSVRRSGIDENRVQGFLLGYSRNLVLIHYVYDFRLDGLMIFNRNDITFIASDKTDLFQTEILKDAGIFGEVDFNIECDLSNWQSALSSMRNLKRFLVVEDEKSDYPLLYIGEVIRIDKDHIDIMEFSGAGNWDKEASTVYFEDISCVQIGNNYANVYEDYFAGTP